MSKRKQGDGKPRKGKRRRRSAKQIAKNAVRAEWKETAFELTLMGYSCRKIAATMSGQVEEGGYGIRRSISKTTIATWLKEKISDIPAEGAEGVRAVELERPD